MFSTQNVLVIATILFLITSCDRNKLDIDVGDVDVQVEKVRLDVGLQGGTIKQDVSLETINADLLKRYPTIYPVYFQDILQLGDPYQPRAAENLALFLEDPLMREVQGEIEKSFSNDILYDKEIDAAFKHYAYYFPNDTIPSVAYYNSGFNYGVYPTPDFIGIGLEWYVGSDNPLLKRLPPAQFPKYLREKMKPEYMLADMLRGYFLVKYSDRIDGKELLQQIVYFGKIAYLVDACIPTEADYIKYGYLPDQVLWCNENEFQIWKSLVSEDMLYSKDRKLINGFIGNAPFTKGFSDRSPGKLAFFIGKRMVMDFMDKNEGLSLTELLNASSSDVLKAYRPKK